MKSTTQASMTTSSGESGKIHTRDKGEMRAKVISNSNAYRLGAEPWILFGARNFTMICVSLCVTQAWQLCQILCRFASRLWLPHPHFYYCEKCFYQRRMHNMEGAKNESRQCSSQMYALIWDMYSYGFGHIIKHFPDMVYHPESEKLVHVRGTCGLGMLRREPLGVLFCPS